MTQSKICIYALSLKRQVGVSFNTAWRIKQNIMQVYDKTKLSGVVQIDDIYYGGELHGGKRSKAEDTHGLVNQRLIIYQFSCRPSF